MNKEDFNEEFINTIISIKYRSMSNIRIKSIQNTMHL